VLLATFSADVGGSESVAELAELQRGAHRILKRFTDAGLPMIVFRDSPFPGFNIPTCLARAERLSWFPLATCDTNRNDVLHSEVFAAEKASVPGVSFIDLSDRICSEKVCHGTEGGVVVYRDDNHLSGAFVDTLAPDLEKDLDQLSYLVREQSL